MFFKILQFGFFISCHWLRQLRSYMAREQLFKLTILLQELKWQKSSLKLAIHFFLCQYIWAMEILAQGVNSSNGSLIILTIFVYPIFGKFQRFDGRFTFCNSSITQSWKEILDQLFKRWSLEMVKHTQTIRRQQSTDCLSVFDHFVGLSLERLDSTINIVKQRS